MGRKRDKLETPGSGADMRVRRRKKRKSKNKVLYVVVAFIAVYTAAELVLCFFSVSSGTPVQLDSTLTTEVFDFAKWVSLSAMSITVKGTGTGRNNGEQEECHDAPPDDG